MSIIKAQNVSKEYGSGESKVAALKDIFLEIKQGEFIAIVGRSGSGKSTLLNVLSGLDTVTNGKIEIDHQDISDLSTNDITLLRRNKIGFIFQSYNLIPVLNVRENIELPQISENSAYVNELMELLEISERQNHMPSQLSGGQQQRCAIARALVNKPNIVFADEPTGNLDSKSEANVIAIFRKLIKNFNTTILLITHNMNLISHADRVIKLFDGEIIDE
ncbi:MAG: ABC transporter ATP-binding protein [Eubacteriales bacterium]